MVLNTSMFALEITSEELIADQLSYIKYYKSTSYETNIDLMIIKNTFNTIRMQHTKIIK